MAENESSHPGIDQLIAFEHGLLGAEEWSKMESHLVGCIDCCNRLDTIPEAPLLTLLRRAVLFPSVLASPPCPAPTVPRIAGRPEIPPEPGP